MKTQHIITTGLTIVLSVSLFFSSCDRIKKPFPAVASGDLDQSLYPGNWNDYLTNEWPVFTPNTNTQRNVLIEDYTGHTCIYCPAQTNNMFTMEATNPARILTVAIHAGSTGLTDLQEVGPAPFTTVLYNDQGLELGKFFGGLPGSDFVGNPRFTVNRTVVNNQFTVVGNSLSTPTDNVLASSLKVNIQSATNYYASTRGMFLHTEVEKIDQSITGDLSMVVYLVEDSLIAPQKFPGGVVQTDYIHRDIMRGCIDGQAFGKKLTAADLNTNGKYYLNYSYRLPDQYDVNNMHLVIYVLDKTTNEIYQVIRQKIN